MLSLSCQLYESTTSFVNMLELWPYKLKKQKQTLFSFIASLSKPGQISKPGHFGILNVFSQDTSTRHKLGLSW